LTITMGAKEESEHLMNALLPLAEKMLKEYGEFYPYGGYMRADGTIVDVGAAEPQTERPQSRELVKILRESFQKMAGTNACKAVAVIFDVTLPLADSDHKRDAIQICLDHVDGYSADVFLPYEIVESEIIYGRIFAQEGRHQIFGGS
jgi:hypothetical protein